MHPVYQFILADLDPAATSTMYTVSDKLLDEEALAVAATAVRESELEVRVTPCLLAGGTAASCNLFTQGLENMAQPSSAISDISWQLPAQPDRQWDEVHLKCENMQNTGSFKIRGVAAQFEAVKKLFSSKSG